MGTENRSFCENMKKKKKFFFFFWGGGEGARGGGARGGGGGARRGRGGVGWGGQGVCEWRSKVFVNSKKKKFWRGGGGLGPGWGV